MWFGQSGDTTPIMPWYRPLNFGRRHGDPVTFHQHLVTSSRLAVDTDEIVLRLGALQSVGEQLLDAGTGSHFDIICETAAVIVNVQNLHEVLLIRILWKLRHAQLTWLLNEI